MEKGRINITERFKKRYLEKLCDASIDDVLTFLITDNITDPERVRNFMIFHDFQIKLIENGGAVTDTYSQLGIEYDLGTRQVERIVANHRAKFKTPNKS